MSTFKVLTISLVSLVFLPLVAIAQPYTNPPGGDYQSNEYDSFTGDSSGLDPLDIIHRANLGTSRTGEQFQEDTNRNLDAAAEEFKLQQQQLLQQQQQPQQ